MFSVFGITQGGSEGSKRLKRQLTERAWAATTGKPVPAAILWKRKQTRLANAKPRPPQPTDWKPAEVKLLGKYPDLKVSAMTGRSHRAVRRKRKLLGILTTRQRKLKAGG